MKALSAFIKKEWLETVRSGKIIILTILFLILGIMNPAITKLTPYMLNMLSDSFSDIGITVSETTVNALTSWTQFFKNIPIGLIAFVLIYNGIFTKEYSAGTLTLAFSKGFQRYKAVLSKSSLMFILWTFFYWLCFIVTYAYNSYFWDNGTVYNLYFSSVCWWLFGIWVIGLLVLMSVIFKNSSLVTFGILITILFSYALGIFPKADEYTVTKLLSASALISNHSSPDSYNISIMLCVTLTFTNICISVPIFNKMKV